MFRGIFLAMGLLLGSVVGTAQAADVVVKMVNFEGEDVPANVAVKPPYNKFPSPYTKTDLTLPAILEIRADFVGVYGSSTNFGNATWNIPAREGKIIRWDVVANALIDSLASGDGSSQVHLVYYAVRPTFGVIDLTGDDIAGAQIILPSYSNETHAAPFVPGYMRVGSTINLRGKLPNGNETATRTVTIKKNIRETINAQNFSQVTEAPYAGSRFDFRYNIFTIPVQTVDLSGDPIVGEIKIGSGAFQSAPVTLSNQVPGTLISVQGRAYGLTTPAANVRLHPDSTFTIATNASVTSAYTPGDPKVHVAFDEVEYEVAVTDLQGNPIVGLNGLTVRGHVQVAGITSDWTPSVVTGSILNGNSVNVRGRFDDLATDTKTAQVLKNHTTIISAGDGVVNPPVSTPGKTRIEFRFDPIEFQASVIGSAGIDLANATVRLVNLTDPQMGTPGYVTVPHQVLIRGGRLLNVEVRYNGVEVYQFNLQTVGGVVHLFNQSGQPAGTQTTDIDKGGFRAQIDDAPVTIQTVDGSGAAVNGEIKVGTGTYQNSPVSMALLNGQTVNVQAKYNNFEMLSSVSVKAHRDSTKKIDAATRQVTATHTPGTTAIHVVFTTALVEIVATDLQGNPIIDLDGLTVRGHVQVNNAANWEPSGYSLLVNNGQSLNVRGRFDDLTTGNKTVQVLKDHTTIISAGDDVVNPPASTPGKTRIEFRFEPIEFQASVIGSLGIDLANATVRLVNITDQNGVPKAVHVPYSVLMRGGRLINVEVYYNNLEAYQFNMVTRGGVIRLYDQSGVLTDSLATAGNKAGFKAQIDDAPVTIRTVDGTGAPVNGEIKIGTGGYQPSPVSLELLNGQGLTIQAKYNNFEMLSSVGVAVHRDSTKSINAQTRQVTSAYAPGTTAIHVVFPTTMVEIAITDLQGNQIIDLDGMTVRGYVQANVNGVTTGWEPSEYSLYVNDGQEIGVKGRFDNQESGFHAVRVFADHTVTINPVTSAIASVSTPGKTRIEFRYDPVVFTAQVWNEHGDNLNAAQVRLVDVTDPQVGTPGFVATPFSALLQNGRNLNMQVQYGLHQPASFGLPKVIGGSVLIFDKDGIQTGAQAIPAGTAGGRIVIDDASVTVKTVFAEADVIGNLNVKLYTNLFQPSPIHIPHIVNGSVLEIAANYNNVNMNAVLAPVVENHTVTINALTREVGAPVATPGQTLILVNFNPNRPPVANAGPDQTVEATGVLTPVTLDGSGSSDPDGDALTYAWTWNGGSAAGVSPQITLPLGVHEIALTVSDSKLEVTDTVLISVVDTSPPVVAVDSPNDGALLTKPSVTVTSPGSGSTVNSSSLTVTGTATDDGSGVASVFVNGVEATRDGDAFEAALSNLPDGPLTIIATATDNAGNAASASIEITIDTTPPVILELTESVVVEATGPDGETVTLSVVAEDALTEAEDLTYHWFVNDNLLGQSASLEVLVAGLGDHTFKVVVTDKAGNAVEKVALVTVQDTTPPVLTLVGGDVNLELGTTFVEPGFSAIDLVNGDLTEAVVVGNPVDVLMEGSYTVTYEVSDASGNTAAATRQVNVVVTANSYVVIATNSVALQQNAKVYTGFVGVVNYGAAPFLGDRELEMKQNAETMAGVQVRSPRAKLNQNARIHGKLIASEANILQNARVNDLEQVGADYWPMFQGIGLPQFLSDTPGSQNIDIKQNTKNAKIDAGAYNKIVIRQNTTVKFTGGEYYIHTLEIQQNANVVFEAPATLLIADRFVLGQNSKFEPGSGLSARDIRVYVAGGNNYKGKKVNLTSDPPVRIGQNSQVSANIYAPNGTLLIETNSRVRGSFIGKDVGLEQNVQAHLESGWNMPGVIYNPGAPALAKPALTKPVVEEAIEAEAFAFGLDQNFPNPFNPSTTIRYTLGDASDVRLVIYNVLGQEVRVLVDAAQNVGLHNVVWDGRDALGRHVASGMYIYHLQAGQNVAIRKLLFAK